MTGSRRASGCGAAARTRRFTAQDWADHIGRTGKFTGRRKSEYGENIGWGSGDKGPARVQSFNLTDPKFWRSAGISYDEVERDEFSIYLIRAKTDTERVQIDLHARVVSFSTGPVSKGPYQSYPILSGSSGTPK